MRPSVRKLVPVNEGANSLSPGPGWALPILATGPRSHLPSLPAGIALQLQDQLLELGSGSRTDNKLVSHWVGNCTQSETHTPWKLTENLIMAGE